MEDIKAWSLFRMRITGALDIFRLYGMDIYIPEAIKEVEVLTKQLIQDLKDSNVNS